MRADSVRDGPTEKACERVRANKYACRKHEREGIADVQSFLKNIKWCVVRWSQYVNFMNACWAFWNLATIVRTVSPDATSHPITVLSAAVSNCLPFLDHDSVPIRLLLMFECMMSEWSTDRMERASHPAIWQHAHVRGCHCQVADREAFDEAGCSSKTHKDNRMYTHIHHQRTYVP